MENDLLAKFRKDKLPDAPEPPVLVANSGKELYAALSTKDKNRGARLDLRTNDGYSHAVAYAHLYEIVYDRRDFKTVYLIFNALSCKIEGLRLRSVVDAVRIGSADFIEEYDPEIHQIPDDADAPVVERMTIVSAAEVRAQKAARGQ